VVHRCIDIRTHEFFLHPERMSANQVSLPESAPALDDCMADAAASVSVVGPAAPPSCIELPESSPLLPLSTLSPSITSSNPFSAPSHPCIGGGNPADDLTLARAGRCPPASATHPAAPASDCPSRRRPPNPHPAAPRPPSSPPARPPPSPPPRNHRPSPGGPVEPFGKRKAACAGEGSAPGTPCNVEAIAWLVGAAAAVAASAAAAASPGAAAAAAAALPSPSPPPSGGEGGAGAGAERHARPPLGGAAAGGGGGAVDADDGAARRKRARHGYAG
jgi:hypothetical protein